jgi:hypothetical protein
MKNVKRAIWIIIFVFLAILVYYIFVVLSENRSTAFVNTKNDIIQVDSSLIDVPLRPPFTIYGRARGNWYFEATFPVEIVDDRGNVIFQGYAEAKDEWMTEEFVPFEAEVSFSVPGGVTSGKIILRKDNPSGLPEYDDSIEIPVKFE